MKPRNLFGRKGSRDGVTLIELVMVIVLTMILSSVVIPPLVIGVEAMYYDWVRTYLVEEARHGMDRAAFEIMRINTQAGIATAAAQDLAFEGIDECGNPLSHSVRIHLIGTNQLELTKCVDPVYTGSTPLSLLIHNTDFQFEYLGHDGEPIGTPIAALGGYTNIRTIRLEGLFHYPDVSPRFDTTYRIVTEVRPRNLLSDKAILP